MSAFFSNRPNSKSTDVVAAINNNFAGFGIPSNTVTEMIGFESASTIQQEAIAATGADIHDQLVENGLEQLLMQQVGTNDAKNPQVLNGMRAGVITAAACANPDAYHESFVKGVANNEATVMDSLFAGQEISLEGYDAVSFDKFAGISIVTNALNAAGSPFSEAFFKTQVLSGTQNGVDIVINNPMVYTKSSRARTGSAFNIDKRSVVRALIDHSILDKDSTKVIPLVQTGDNTNAAVLVDSSIVANEEVTVEGQTLYTRPLVYGTKIDLLAVSTHDDLLASKAQDETDTLDLAVGFGTQYLLLTNTSGDSDVTGVVKVDTTNLRGSLLSTVAEGASRDLSGVLEATVYISSTDETVSGNTIETQMAFATLLGLETTDEYRLQVTIRLSGQLEANTGNILVDCNAVTIDKAESIIDDVVTEVELADTITISGAGYVPAATRSNTNMSTMGNVIDMSDSVTARIPARLQTPLTIQQPVSGAAGATTMDGVNMVKRAVSSNLAITELMRFAQQLGSSAGEIAGSPAIGALAGIKPTLVSKTVDISDKTVSISSKDSLEDLRGSIAAAVSVVTDKVLKDSGYLASLQMFTGSEANYEVVLGTDPQVANLLMTSGDARTLGAGHNFVIAPTHDARVKGKIYIGLRRTDTEAITPHDTGAKVLVPSLVHKATLPTGTGVSNATIIIPRENFAGICPALGEITLDGMDSVFID